MRWTPDEHPYYAEIAHLRVSAHFLVRRDGELLQFVPTTRRAWHAGQSCWRGRSRCNDFRSASSSRAAIARASRKRSIASCLRCSPDWCGATRSSRCRDTRNRTRPQDRPGPDVQWQRLETVLRSVVSRAPETRRRGLRRRFDTKIIVARLVCAAV